MGKLQSFWNVMRRHKYAVAVLIFALLIGFVDDHSLWNRYRHKKEQIELRTELRRYTEMYEHDTRYLEEMNSNPEVLVEIARERYHMHAPDEDLFIVKESGDDEGAE